MPGTPWTPRIVGGTDYDYKVLPEPKTPEAPVRLKTTAAPKPVPPHKPPIQNNRKAPEFVEPTDLSEVEYISENELMVHAALLTGVPVDWAYGPLTRYQDGAQQREGQYVNQFIDGLLVKTYWVEG